ncbi:isopenicillin-N epimerase [Mycolicibacterium madagascariense]|uniref:Isopenicillin-N epimerase n=1 Tax=Mycolicibacterium madagascariense TaxID=212765 RepID=A0A7I7X8R5_9MYCO|nr:aminotransferase class V-fold PLP-dependent enzyme [Mycolicibacterium madagascariense]MCV7012840.1 aminotransferase class V-fold PLP-dependent enzyme [Mycolicibacterium madagascariense]BBZ26086.1 isopenicillin-N epimerase [Mycolicibacterium madagascariense]
MLNHASYGLAPTAMLEHCAALRAELERDPNTTLGDALLVRLRGVVDAVARELGWPAECCALTTSATAGAAAVQRSVALGPGDTVVVLDCEYSSVIRGWRRRCDEVGATLTVVPVRLPFDDAGELLDEMSCRAPDSVAVLQFSAITSSAALRLPVAELAAWGRRRGATVVVDAAHGPFHVGLDWWRDVDVVFGTLHKWLPVPRSVGIVYGAVPLYPAETSLTFDEACPADRFGWPGTFDPASRLALPEAIALHRTWQAAGLFAECADLADHASDALEAVGAVPTAAVGFRPPRLRSFLLPGVDLDALRRRLIDADIRAWTGRYDASTALVRVATHVYNDQRDVDALVRVVGAGR